MRSRIRLSFMLFVGCLLLNSTAHASWAYAFVVFNEGIYAITDERLDPSVIGKKIGTVTSYSDREGVEYIGNFSNALPKGTEYYKIKGTDVKAAIAVKKSNAVLLKADYKGKYEGKDRPHNFIPYFIGGLLLLVFFYFSIKRVRRAS